MKQITVMIKPASALCNLKCKYCFYEEVSNARKTPSFGRMQEETVVKMLEKMEQFLVDGDKINFAFQGGEPMLAGKEYFKGFVEKVKAWEKKIEVSYALQTNGTLMDEVWAQFFFENQFLLGISLDLLEEYHNEARVDPQKEGTWTTVCHTIKLLEKMNVEYNVLCTLTDSIARYPEKVWKEILRLDLKYVQFTPCLGNLDPEKESRYALTPKNFSKFYQVIFKNWLKEYQEGNYRSIKLLDDIANLLGCGIITACGMDGKCQAQLIVEADGSVYPCDFYCLDEYCLGNIQSCSVEELYRKSFASPTKKQEALPLKCGTCRYRKICGGNCKRMRKEICLVGEDNFCGYQDFLNAVMNDFIKIIQKK